MDSSMEREIESVPSLLYKFRRWKDRNDNDYEHDQKILRDRAIWFASPADFNDPFDCKIPYRYDLMSSVDQYQRAYEIRQKKLPEWCAERLKTETEMEVKSNPLFSKDPKVALQAQVGIFQYLEETYGVLSFAGNCNNMLMWSHYACSHRGFCVELDGKALAYQLFGLLLTDGEGIDGRRVQYSRDIPVITPSTDEGEDRERYVSLLISKSQDWDYEEEYRFIYIGKNRLSRGINSNIIKRVIFGCQMPLEHRIEVAEIVRARLPNTQLWEAVRSNEQFKLEFRPWNPEGK